MKNVNNSWFMILRKVYLTYTVCLAGLLILLISFSFGMQIFYNFRTAEINEELDPYVILSIQSIYFYLF